MIERRQATAGPRIAAPAMGAGKLASGRERKACPDPPAHGAWLPAPLLPPVARRIDGQRGKGEQAGNAGANEPGSWFD